MARREGFLLVHVLRDHVLLGGLAALALSRIWPASYCLAFWLANILIDLDHYLDVIYWSDFRALRFHQTFHYSAHITENKFRQPFIAVEVFHTAEFALAAALLSPVFGIFKPILAGLLLHIVVDWVHLLRLGSLRLRCHSFLEFWLRKRKMEREGLSPTRLQREAAQAAVRCCEDWRWPLI